MTSNATRTALALATLLAVACGGGGGEAPADSPPPSAAADADRSSAADATDTAGTDDAAIGATLLDPDEAGREALLAVEGLDEAAVEALIAARPFEDMLAVDAALAEHLDPAAREGVYAALWKPLDLNSATAEEIELIPGVGPRMRHEFEEYRPYRAMEQFRREIGKYVDEAEVERLARYVELR